MDSCSVCGGPLKGGNRCPFCGHVKEDKKSFDVGNAGMTFSIFNNENWQDLWRKGRAQNNRVGIIMTNLERLNDDEYADIIDEYIKRKETIGISYYLLDVSAQRVKRVDEESCIEIVELLKTIYSVAVPNYLFILGDASIIPSIVWDNECADGDETVSSDLPYITLDTDSPWDGLCYNFDGVTSVGRLPATAKTVKGVANYFLCMSKNNNIGTDINAFVYSAKVWEDTSCNTYEHLDPTLFLSPQYTINEEYVAEYGMRRFNEDLNEYNLICFNLHGSDATDYWYGQEEDCYPEAYDCESLPSKSGYVICAEACYGAKPKITKNNTSILVQALYSGCLAFVGSSRIAYGCADGSMSCADIIAYHFSLALQKGEEFGSAFLKALDMISFDEMSETETKTLAEFALYGDPSGRLCLTREQSKSGVRVVKYPKITRNDNLSVKLMSCNSIKDFETVSAKGGITLMGCKAKSSFEIKQMVKQVSNKSNEVVLKKFSSYGSVEPSIYKVVGRRGYRAVYNKTIDNVETVLRVYLDDDGKVDKIYVSK